MRRGSRQIGYFVVACIAMAAPGSASPLRLGPVFTETHPRIDVVLEAPAVPKLPAAGELTLLREDRPLGPAQSIVPFSQSGHTLALVVAVDASRTMAGPPLDDLKNALRTLVSTRGPREEVALLSFADDVVVESPFGAPPKDLTAAIDRLAPRGRITELYKGVFKALALLEEKQGVRPRLLVVSDGRDEGEAYELDDVIERAESLRIPVDAMGLSRIDPRYLSTLERLADLTGGVYFRAGGRQDLERVLGSGIQRLRATPVARFEAPDLPRDGARHRLRVRWARSGEVLEEEVLAALPPAAETLVEPGKDEGEDEESWIDRLKSEPLLAAAGGGLLLLAGLAVLWWLYGRRGRSARNGPHPVPARAEPAPARPIAAQAAVPAAPPPPPEPAAPVAPPPRRATRFRHAFAAPAAGSPTAILLGEGGSRAGARIPVDRDPFWIGAEEGNDLVIAEDVYLSSHHACLYVRDATLLIQDPGSTNGTFVNAERLTGEPRALGPGDHIRVGRTEFRLLAS